MARVVYGDTNEQSLQNEKDPLFESIKRSVTECEQNTVQWSSKQQKYHRIRKCIKKEKTFPFKDSSNLRIPTAEIQIRKVKAGILGQIYGIRPVVCALPSPGASPDTGFKIEKLLDHLIMDVIGLELKSEIGVDQSLEKGFYLAKPHWCREIVEREEKVELEDMPLAEVMAIFTMDKDQILPVVFQRFEIDKHDSVFEYNKDAVERAIDEILSGKEEVVINFKDVVYDFPDVDFISPERVYVPTDTGYDPQKAKLLTVEFFLPLDIVKANAEYKGWDKDAINKLIALKGLDVDKETDLDKDTREGISRMNNPSGLVRIWESYGWCDIDDDGKAEKSMVTSFPDFGEVARKVLVDSYSGKYPIVKLFYELTENRWFSHRGIPEMDEDMIKEIDVQHNMKIDAQTMRNAPMIVYRAGMVNPNLVGTNPGAAIPVNGLNPLNDTIAAINMHNPNAEFSYEREQMILETKIQEMHGQIDYSLQSLINKRQPRTLGEVEAQATGASNNFALDVKHYISSFSQIFEMIWELWCQYGPDEYEFLYFGQSQRGEKIKLTKEEIQGKYRITVRGNDQNTNPNTKIQKAQQILLGATNPILLQLGVVGPQQVANAVKRFYQTMGIDSWEELINPQPQPQQPPDPKLAITPKFDDMTNSEQAQVLAAHGIQVDPPGRDQKEHIELLEKAAEIANKVS